MVYTFTKSMLILLKNILNEIIQVVLWAEQKRGGNCMVIRKKKLVLCLISIGCVLLLCLTAMWYMFALTV